MVKNDYGQNLAYQCDSCSRRYPKWQGKCDGCNEWNTIVEKMVYSNDLGSKNDWIKIFYCFWTLGQTGHVDTKTFR